MKRRKSEFEDAMLVNDATYIDYLERLKRIAMTMFEWENLPDSMDGRYIERCLYYFGQAGLLKDETYGFINTKATASGGINIYGLPTEINCYSYGYSQNRKVYSGIQDEETDSAILVMNNWERTATCSSMELFAYRMYLAQRSADVNVANQKYPLLLLVDENQRLTMRNIYEQYDGNAPVIFGDKNQLSVDSIKSIKTDAPYVVDKLMDYKAQIWSEALTYLGINNNPTEKSERLISGEVNANNEVINMNLQAFYAPRKKACEDFNKKFGTNIDVKLRSDIFNLIKMHESTSEVYLPEDDANLDETVTTDLGDY